LVATAELPATLSADPRFDDAEVAVGNDVAMAAFATVSAALRALNDPSPNACAHVSLTREVGTLTARVDLQTGGQPVDPDRLTDAADRVVAAGGHLTITSSASDQVVSAVIPCAW
jgi:hypothetical protein